MFDALLTSQQLGPTRVRNRIFNPPHGTTLGRNGVVTDDLVAYHRTRARGGAGLIVLEGMTLHPSYGFAESFLYAGDDRIVDGLGRLGEAGLVCDSTLYRPFATEGGHADFAPGSEREWQLLRFLQDRFGSHVSWERVVSGPGACFVASLPVQP